jgi:hypothetical protein
MEEKKNITITHKDTNLCDSTQWLTSTGGDQIHKQNIFTHKEFSSILNLQAGYNQALSNTTSNSQSIMRNIHI